MKDMIQYPQKERFRISRSLVGRFSGNICHKGNRQKTGLQHRIKRYFDRYGRLGYYSKTSSSSSQPQRISTSSSPLTLNTYLGQWDNNRCDVSRDMKYACVVELGLLCLCYLHKKSCIFSLGSRINICKQISACPLTRS